MTEERTNISVNPKSNANKLFKDDAWRIIKAMQPSNTNAENHPQFELPNFPDGLERQNEKSTEKSADKESEAGKNKPLLTDDAKTDFPDLSSVQAPTTSLPTDVHEAKDSLAAAQIQSPDRLDKEWLLRTKSIIAQTRDDPHEQKNEISKVKAEYIKEYFGKSVPTDDSIAA